jgi:hypothetical protein
MLLHLLQIIKSTRLSQEMLSKAAVLHIKYSIYLLIFKGPNKSREAVSLNYA